MNKEYEIKVLDVDPDEIKNKLINLGAKKKFDKLFKIYSYKIDDSSTNVEEHARLRDEGDKITLAYKKKTGSGIDETEEIEFEVTDFEKAALFLSKFKFNGIFYQEKRRIMYVLEDIEFCIDFWPKIPPFLEIESSSEEKVMRGLDLLGIEEHEENISIVDIYKQKGLDIHSFKELKFD